ncbi:MAG: hypothetical protein QOF74_9106 [Caballeronia mineralivorans]|nr:hypothetical protein [Caballeronia mineralivorans]
MLTQRFPVGACNDPEALRRHSGKSGRRCGVMRWLNRKRRTGDDGELRNLCHTVLKTA